MRMNYRKPRSVAFLCVSLYFSVSTSICFAAEGQLEGLSPGQSEDSTVKTTATGEDFAALALDMTNPRYYEMGSVEVKEIGPDASKEVTRLELNTKYLDQGGTDNLLGDISAPISKGKSKNKGKKAPDEKSEGDSASKYKGPTGLEKYEAQAKAIDRIVSTIIGTGTKIWKVAEKATPVVHVKGAEANALPAAIPDWRSMEGWQNPISRTFHVAYKNQLNMTVVDFSYRIQYMPGGSYKGHGLFLADVMVEQAGVHVLPGFNFEAEAKVTEARNMGTETRPVAGMGLSISWKIQRLWFYDEYSASYFVRGDGGFQQN